MKDNNSNKNYNNLGNIHHSYCDCDCDCDCYCTINKSNNNTVIHTTGTQNERMLQTQSSNMTRKNVFVSQKTMVTNLLPIQSQLKQQQQQMQQQQLKQQQQRLPINRIRKPFCHQLSKLEQRILLNICLCMLCLCYNCNNTIVPVIYFASATKTIVQQQQQQQQDNDNKNYQSNLFSLVDSIRVNAPTTFPKPTHLLDIYDKDNDENDIDNDNGNENRHEQSKQYSNNSKKTAVPIVQPLMGQHRQEQDAIFAYAEGYPLSVYMMFLETLTDSGYTGDVVFAIAEQRILKPYVIEYLQTYTTNQSNNKNNNINSKPNVIVYQQNLYCEVREGSTEYGIRQLTSKGETDVFQMCQLSNVYGYIDPETNVTTPVPDPREGRVVATIRYEWYWIWSLQYNHYSWIMLIDARDSFFQSNPFIDLPRRSSSTTSTSSTTNTGGGLLYFFGENSNVTRIGISKKNSQWILKGYGEETLIVLQNKPTICSGSTMGEQIAVETYLRAMINEHDESTIRMTGSDQGFHNYLYYSSKLLHCTKTISKIIVWEQGYGIINNLGALRTKSLNDWGIINTSTNKLTDTIDYSIYQWDKKTVSPVCHQFDRDNTMHKYMQRKQRLWEKQFLKQQVKENVFVKE